MADARGEPDDPRTWPEYRTVLDLLMRLGSAIVPNGTTGALDILDQLVKRAAVPRSSGAPRAEEVAKVLSAKLQFLINYLGIEHFTFPDGDTWERTKGSPGG